MMNMSSAACHRSRAVTAADTPISPEHEDALTQARRERKLLPSSSQIRELSTAVYSEYYNLEKIKGIIEKQGIDVDAPITRDGKNLLHCAMTFVKTPDYFPHYEGTVIDCSFQSNNDVTFEWSVAKRQDPQLTLVRYLIEHLGADVLKSSLLTTDGYSCFAAACFDGTAPLAQYLIDVCGFHVVEAFIDSEQQRAKGDGIGEHVVSSPPPLSSSSADGGSKPDCRVKYVPGVCVNSTSAPLHFLPTFIATHDDTYCVLKTLLDNGAATSEGDTLWQYRSRSRFPLRISKSKHAGSSSFILPPYQHPFQAASYPLQDSHHHHHAKDEGETFFEEEPLAYTFVNERIGRKYMTGQFDSTRSYSDDEWSDTDGNDSEDEVEGFSVKNKLMDFFGMNKKKQSETKRLQALRREAMAMSSGHSSQHRSGGDNSDVAGGGGDNNKSALTKHSRSPLWGAATNGSVLCVQLLLDSGCDVTAELVRACLDQLATPGPEVPRPGSKEAKQLAVREVLLENCGWLLE